MDSPFVQLTSKSATLSENMHKKLELNQIYFKLGEAVNQEQKLHINNLSVFYLYSKMDF